MAKGSNLKFDLEERTALFAEKVIEFTKKLPKDLRYSSVITQLVRAATSIGANYCEADDAHSRKDFFHKISICKKESRETKYWLRIIAKTFPDFTEESRLIWGEARELNLIFAAIIKKKDSI
jgi:four helix bundle protein